MTAEGQGDKLVIRELQARNVIGVDNWERLKPQPIVIHMNLYLSTVKVGSSDLLASSLSYSDVAKRATEFVEGSSFKTLEALTASLALLCITEFRLQKVDVTVEKPRALLHAAAAAVQITRTREDIEILQHWEVTRMEEIAAMPEHRGPSPSPTASLVRDHAHSHSLSHSHSQSHSRARPSAATTATISEKSAETTETPETKVTFTADEQLQGNAPSESAAVASATERPSRSTTNKLEASLAHNLHQFNLQRNARAHAWNAGSSSSSHAQFVSSASSSSSSSAPLFFPPSAIHDVIRIKDLTLSTIIGINPWERIEKQRVLLNIEFYPHALLAASRSSTDAKIAATSSISGDIIMGTTGVGLPLLSRTSLHMDPLLYPGFDRVLSSYNYRSLTRLITDLVESSSFKTVEALAASIAEECIIKSRVAKVTVRVEKPSALLFAAGAGCEITRDVTMYSNELARAFAQDTNYSLPSIPRRFEIFPSGEGKNALFPQGSPAPSSDPLDRSQTSAVSAEASEASKAPSSSKDSSAAVHFGSATSPSSSSFSSSSSQSSSTSSSSSSSSSFSFETSTHGKQVDGISVSLVEGHHEAFIALGTNIGNRAANIELALQNLLRSNYCQLLDTSFLYETPPMHVTDQPAFLNAVCKVSTTLSPDALLAFLKSIESEMGRLPTYRYGPRVINLDILYYDNIEYRTESLSIPHPLLHEREFVLRPLCDIAAELEHPKLCRTSRQLLKLLEHGSQSDGKTKAKIWQVCNMRSMLFRWGERTFIMGILNVTPDSFSDGGSFESVDKALEHALRMKADGADMIDIGGMSTRPNADDVPESVEIERVVPVIKAIRAKDSDIVISIDTFRASVAKVAVEAGADVINDVTGGRDPEMLPLAASLGVPIVLMHMRGTPKTMSTLTDYGPERPLAKCGDAWKGSATTTGSAPASSSSVSHPSSSATVATTTSQSQSHADGTSGSEYSGVAQAVCRSLANVVTQAVRKAGIRRWNIILDPGIGFAKNSEQNIRLLREGKMICRHDPRIENYPLLVGPSRKKFISDAINYQTQQQLLSSTSDSVHNFSKDRQEGFPVHQQNPTGTSEPSSFASASSAFASASSGSDSNQGADHYRYEQQQQIHHPPPSSAATSASSSNVSLPAVPAKDRVWGTTAAVCAAIAGGAEIVRVHDVREMRDVVRVADAIWRGQI